MTDEEEREHCERVADRITDAWCAEVKALPSDTEVGELYVLLREELIRERAAAREGMVDANDANLHLVSECMKAFAAGEAKARSEHRTLLQDVLYLLCQHVGNDTRGIVWNPIRTRIKDALK